MIYINGRFLTQKLTGVQRFAFEMVKGLINLQQYPLCILVPPKDIDPSFENFDLPFKVIGKRTSTLWEQIDLPLYLKNNNKPLLINLVNTAPAFYKNQIISIMDMTTFVNPKWFNFKFVYYYRLIVPLIAKNSIKVITISENSKQDIVKFLNTDPEKIAVLFCGIADKFMLEASGKDQILDKFNLSANKYILAVSSLDPRKNFKRLIEAYNLSELTAPLVIVGSKGKVFADDGLKDLIGNKENIIFTGYVSDEDLVQLYGHATCFIYPSLYEGFGMPPLEAMACGCAVIVSNTSSLPEVCGDACLYVDPENVISIKNAIITVYNDSGLRTKLIQLGKNQVKKFRWDESVIKLTKIVDNIVH